MISADLFAAAAAFENHPDWAFVGTQGACRTITTREARVFFTTLLAPTEQELVEYNHSEVYWLEERMYDKQGKHQSFMKRLGEGYTVRTMALQLAAHVAEEEGK